jgi:chitinase
MKKHIVILLIYIFLVNILYSSAADTRIVGYYAGNTRPLDSVEVGKLTHLIYCFGKLEGNRFSLRNQSDTVMIHEMVGLKKKYPFLKVMLSLGGWSGCETCSPVFSTDSGRLEFSISVKAISDYFGTDGIDLDWEYPAVKGFPGHPFDAGDKENFTDLLQSLRRTCGDSFQLSFAAGGFSAYIDSSVDWKQAITYVDFINIMTYDLVHGYSTTSGHHTPLYSTSSQLESTDHAVRRLVEYGVPPEKLVIGCAFYGRVFELKENRPFGLYQPCKFLYTYRYYERDKFVSSELGFVLLYDSVAHASYAYNPSRALLATYDDENSVGLKADYTLQNKLGGVMFWQLCDDKPSGGLLDVIYRRLNAR